MSGILTSADYVVIGATLGFSALVGLYFRFTGDRQRTTREFLRAGRNMNILPVTFSLMASTFSAVASLGTPAEVYSYGIQILYLEISYNFGGLVAVYLFLPVFFDMDISTCYEYLEKRFGKVTRYLASVLFCIQIILFVPVVIYAPSLALSTVTGLSLWTSVLSMAVVCIFYSSLGGLKAVLWTDFFQSILMFLSSFLVIVKGSMEMGTNTYEIAKEGGRFDIQLSSDLTVRYTIWNCLFQGFIFGFYLTGTCHVQVQRLMSVKDLKSAQKSYLLSIPINFLYKASCCFSGIVVYSYFHDCDPLQTKEGNISSSDQLIPYIILKLFSNLPGMPGLCIAGILSASLSTMSSAINSLVTVTVEDFIKPLHKNLKDSTLSLSAKILGLVYGVISVLLIFVIATHKGVVEGTALMSGMIGGPTLGIYFLGMFTSSANEIGVLMGLFTGIAINAWMAFGSLLNKVKYPTLPLSTAGCAFANSTSYSPYYVSTTDEDISFENELRNVTEIYIPSNEKERYIFPLYKVSYMWFATFSTLTVIVVGYISSKIIGKWKKQEKVDPRHLSPVVKRWLCKVSEADKQYIQLPMSVNQIELTEKLHMFLKEDHI